MPTPRITPNPPDGSGLLDQLVQEDYEALITGRPSELRVARVMLQAVGQTSRRTKNGIKTTTQYEIVRLEPCRDRHDADTVAWEIQRAYEQRSSGSSQEMLPLNSPAEQRNGLLDAIGEHASDLDMDAEALNAKWTDYFGGRLHSTSETPTAGSLVQLMEFARYFGAVADRVEGSEPTGDDGEADLDEPAPVEPAADEIPGQMPLRVVPFQDPS